MKLPLQDAFDGILVVSEDWRTARDCYFWPAIKAALIHRARIKKDEGLTAATRTWLIVDTDGTLTAPVIQVADHLGLGDDIAECGNSNDVCFGDITGRIVILNFTVPTSRVAKENRGGKTRQDSPNHALVHALTLLKAPPAPSCKISGLFLCEKLTIGDKVTTSNGLEPWEFAGQLLSQNSAAVMLGHTHLPPIQQPADQFPIYDRFKTKLFFRCQNPATADLVNHWCDYILPNRGTTPQIHTGTIFHLRTTTAEAEYLKLEWYLSASPATVGVAPRDTTLDTPSLGNSTRLEKSPVISQQPAGGPIHPAAPAQQTGSYKLWTK